MKNINVLGIFTCGITLGSWQIVQTIGCFRNMSDVQLTYCVKYLLLVHFLG